MQPLSQFKGPKHHLNFGDDHTMERCPAVAIKVAECIMEWSNIESMLAIFAGLLLRTDGKTSLAIYAALENRSAQLRMLEAAVEAKLPLKQSDVFAVLMDRFLRPAMKTRDKFAHWCWGSTPGVPNGLLLIEPDEKTSLHFAALHGPIEFDRKKVFVITEKYMTNTLRDFRQAQRYLAMFAQMVASKRTVIPSRAPAQLLKTLCSVPEIRKGVDRRMASREKPLPEPPLLPEEWHLLKS